jgi:hypothetical protein
MHIPFRSVFVLLVIFAIAHAESWCERDDAAINTYLEALSRPELIRLARVGLLEPCARSELHRPKAGFAISASHHRVSAIPRPQKVLNRTLDDTHVIQRRPHHLSENINPVERRSRNLLQQGPDVDDATLTLLQQAFGSICSPQEECTCFNGSAQIVRPVCSSSSWANCDANGNLIHVYVFNK